MGYSPRRAKSIRGILFIASLVSVLLFPPMLSNKAAAIGDSHLYEFSNAGEQSKWMGTWVFSSYDGIVNVDVYGYCDVYQQCILVGLDTTNNMPLGDYSADNFFQNYAISQILFTDEQYRDPFVGSQACEAVIPRLKSEMVNLAASSGGHLGEALLTSSEAKAIKVGLSTARFLGLIGDFNVAAFAFAATCIGSNLFENSIADEIKKCHELAYDVKLQMASETSAGDLIACNEKLVDSLGNAKYSINTILQHAETKIWNFWSSINCAFGNTECTDPQKSTLEVIDEMTPIIQNTVVQMRSAILDASDDARASQSRISEKYQQANALASDFENLYVTMDEKASKHRWLNVISDWLSTPQYDSASVDQWTSKASQKHSDTVYNMQTYRLNSAIASAKEGLQLASNAMVALDEQEKIAREPDLSKWAMVVGIPILAAAGFIGIKMFRHSRYH